MFNTNQENLAILKSLWKRGLFAEKRIKEINVFYLFFWKLYRKMKSIYFFIGFNLYSNDKSILKYRSILKHLRLCMSNPYLYILRFGRYPYFSNCVINMIDCINGWSTDERKNPDYDRQLDSLCYFGDLLNRYCDKNHIASNLELLFDLVEFKKRMFFDPSNLNMEK